MPDTLRRVSGSHHVLIHVDDPRRAVTVPFHGALSRTHRGEVLRPLATGRRSISSPATCREGVYCCAAHRCEALA